MPAETPVPAGELRVIFQELLNVALTRGRVTPDSSGLGPSTLAAINVVAHEHPDAEAEVIAAAYDAFEREHGCSRVEPIEGAWCGP
jgi:hypothetical protein